MFLKLKTKMVSKNKTFKKETRRCEGFRRVSFVKVFEREACSRDYYFYLGMQANLI
jgi:hypothetical protein